MATNEDFEPDYAIPPGETILESLEALGISREEFSARMSMSTAQTDDLIAGKKELTDEIARHLEAVLDVPAILWLNLEQSYRKTLARLRSADDFKSQTG